MANPPDKAANATGLPPADELGVWLAQYGPALRRYFSRKVNPADADDLVQEVFLRLQARTDRAPAESPERFLFAVAKRVLIDRYRLNTARSEQLQDLIDGFTDDADELSPERIIEAKQDFARAIAAITDMPPRMQTAFVLHRFGRMSYGAIAKRMGIGKSAVQNLMERALERITNQLGDAP